jgi:hypothetical protein
MITLNKFLLASGVGLDLKSYKIHLATTDEGENPLAVFLAGRFKEWQEDQKQDNFNQKHIISLIELKLHTWLFAGVYQVLGKPKRLPNKRVLYDTAMLPDQDELVGRLIIHHERTVRSSYRIGGPGLSKDFTLAELRHKKLTVEEFPGYHAVNISYTKLRIIIDQSIDSWRGALSNMKGVYLITDASNGKLYVGSATGGKGLWQRWSDYARNGHGDVRDLKAVLREKGEAHASNFQYSILEIADSHASDVYVKQREQYWKCVLLSRKFGYNLN